MKKSRDQRSSKIAGDGQYRGMNNRYKPNAHQKAASSGSTQLSLVVLAILLHFVTGCIFVIDPTKKRPVPDNATKATDSTVANKLNSVDSAAAKSNKEIYNGAEDTTVLIPDRKIDTKGIPPNKVVSFAETLIGTPYKYASTNPETGFDCSGFVTYVFNQFNIQVPRSSIEFTNTGTEVPVTQARRGDLILFTGTDSTERFVGHMGIVVSNSDTLKFIHATSGKAYGVTITPLNNYYKSRFVKTVRIFGP